jgi:hypothetical protein
MSSRGLTVIAALAAAITGMTLAAAPTKAVASPIVATWFVHGDGAGGGVAGSVSGSLLADGTATGSGEIAIDTPPGRTTLQIRAVSWVPISATSDGILDMTSTGQPDCLIVPIGRGQPEVVDHTFTSNCFDPALDIGTYGKVTPVG